MIQAALILLCFGANYERIAIRPTRPESGRATSFVIFCRHYCTLCRVRSTDSHLAGVQGIGFREPTGIHFLQWLNFLHHLWHCQWCALLYSHWISPSVSSIHFCYLGTHQSSACGARWEIARIPACNQVLTNELILRVAACEAIVSSKSKQSMVFRGPEYSVIRGHAFFRCKLGSTPFTFMAYFQ